MNTVSYIEAQQNFADILQKATKENIVIDGIDGNKFILSLFQQTLPIENKNKFTAMRLKTKNFTFNRDELHER